MIFLIYCIGINGTCVEYVKYAPVWNIPQKKLTMYTGIWNEIPHRFQERVAFYKHWIPFLWWEQAQLQQKKNKLVTLDTSLFPTKPLL